jgi:hypothetical protein
MPPPMTAESFGDRPLAPHVADYVAEHGGNMHHFALTRDIVDTIGRKAALDTCRDLAKAELLHLPYPACAVSFRRDDISTIRHGTPRRCG